MSGRMVFAWFVIALIFAAGAVFVGLPWWFAFIVGAVVGSVSLWIWGGEK